MKTETLISDLKAAVKSGKGNYGHRLLCGQAAERIASLIIALKAAEKDLAVVEREISGLAPEAKSQALPLVRFALGMTASDRGTAE